MAIKIQDGFEVETNKPIDDRFVFADLTARDALDPLLRYQGLKSFVISEGIAFRLIGGIDNANWVEESGSGGGASYRVQDGTFANASNEVIADDKDVLIIRESSPGNIVATQTITLPTAELDDPRVITIISKGEATTLIIDGDGNDVDYVPNIIKPGDVIQYLFDVTTSTWNCMNYYYGGGADTKSDITGDGVVAVKNVPKQLIRLNPNNEYTMTLPNGTIRQQLLYLRIFDIGSCRFQGWPANNTSNVTLKDRASEVIMSQNDQMTLLWDEYEELWYQI